MKLKVTTASNYGEIRARSGFTLVELLVVMGVVAMLAAVLVPSLSAARAQARAVACQSNLAQIITANGYYAEESGGFYCPGAADFRVNHDRWHGRRDDRNDAFDSTRGPLVPYLGPEGAIRKCPTFPAAEIAAQSGGFERGNGGYGYNKDFIGVQLTEVSPGVFDVSDDRAGALAARVRRPAETVMFTDAAMAEKTLIEYSFAEPRFFPEYPRFRPVPSVHFRHRGKANVGWCDGHVDAQKMTYTEWSRVYPTDPARFDIGWFGTADDNSLFDLK